MPEINSLIDAPYADMAPLKALPLPPEFTNEEAYVESLLAFVTSHKLFQQLCGGVHILDFLTQEPALYSTLLPEKWTTWFRLHDISDILDLLMRENLSQFGIQSDRHTSSDRSDASSSCNGDNEWRGHPSPPPCLLQYIEDVRKHTLDRQVDSARKDNQSDLGKMKLAKHVAVGMKSKKIHEVEHFVKYIDELTSHITSSTKHEISHIVDFGSGQNYLGRALASPPYCKDVVAIESKQHNIGGAKTMDIFAKLAEKEKIMRNKKEYRLAKENPPNETRSSTASPRASNSANAKDHNRTTAPKATGLQSGEMHGSLQYLEIMIRDGDLSVIVPQINIRNVLGEGTPDPQLVVISLHSCGNLLHHGLRSLVLNPSVKAVAMVGCCYNLVTERLGPPTYKLPSLRHSNERLYSTSNRCDPDGFPMSERLVGYKHQHGEGIRMNITARMMAVQAPQNWTPKESEDFFTRHFFRALLQRILVDKGLLGKPAADASSEHAGSPRGWSGPGQAVIIGSLRKHCYNSFIAYVCGAFAKLGDDPIHAKAITKLKNELTGEEIAEYEDTYKDKKKELSIVWSLMAFSAGVVESTIIVDRWLYLRERKEVKECWVEAVFDYEKSPRNLVVVGIKD